MVYLARALATTGPARDGDTNTRADPDDVLIRHEARFMNILAVRSVFTSTQLCIARSAVRVSAALSILVRLAADRIVGMEQSASAMDADIPRRMDARDTSAALATLLRGAQRRSVEFSPLFSRTGDEVRAALGAERHHHALMQAARPTLHHLRQLRGVLVEGIVKNQIVFKLSTETTSLAVAYLDVFLGSGKYAVTPEQGRNTRWQTTGVPWETPPPVRPCVYTETSFTPPFPSVPSRARVPSPSSA